MSEISREEIEADGYQPRTRERVIEILESQSQNPRSWQREAAAFIAAARARREESFADKARRFFARLLYRRISCYYCGRWRWEDCSSIRCSWKYGPPGGML